MFKHKTSDNLLSVVIAVLVSLFLAAPVMAESKAQRQARMAWWKEARFGMFIHWGLYAIPAGQWQGKPVEGIGEWIMHHAKIPKKDYVPLQQQFNPIDYDARQWVRIAKDAGMKYIVITSKHHDGFCLWDSELTEFDVINTPYGRDLLAPLAKACREEGLSLCFYHSIMDWTHPDYEPLPNWDPNRKGHRGDFEEYVKYMKNQVRELVVNYDPAILWFDGEWESTWTHKHGKMMYDYCRSLKLSILVNNRVDKGRQGMQGMNKDGGFRGDFGTPEQEIPEQGLGDVDWESCMTMNDTWGFKKNDHNWKSSEDLIRNLIDIAGKGGNYLLNIGPTAAGKIPKPSIERLKDIGQWMKINNQSIYGTTASPFVKLTWGRCTKKVTDNKTILYLHVFDWPKNNKLTLEGLRNPLKKAWLLDGNKPLPTSRENNATTVHLPAKPVDPIATVIAVEIKGKLVVDDVSHHL